MLCASCLADPGERAAYERIARAASANGAIARHFAYAHHAMLLARTYAIEAGPNDPRVVACVDEVRRCRD